MKDFNCQGYVYSEDIRIIIKWVVPIVILFLGVVSFCCLRIAIIEAEDRSANTIVAVTCALLSGLMMIGWKKAMITISLQYACTDNIIQNHSKAEKNVVDVKYSIFISQTVIAGVTRAPWSERLYLLSNEPMLYVPNHEGNGMLVVQSLAKKGVVILPINDATQSVIEQLTGNIVVPTYPKVAYIQR